MLPPLASLSHPGMRRPTIACHSAARSSSIARMSSRPRILLSWSSGKDSAWTLHVLRQQGQVEVVALLTTLDAPRDRVSVHSVRRQLLMAQAEAAGLPLWEVPLPGICDNATYEAAMTPVIDRARSERIEAIAFGDLFLEDIRAYREQRMAGTGIRPMFPLWQRPTAELAEEMFRAGVTAHVTSVDPGQIPGELAGRTWDAAFVSALPDGADPCGENGEFHTFVSSGPMFDRELSVVARPAEQRDGFVYADLVLQALQG